MFLSTFMYVAFLCGYCMNVYRSWYIGWYTWFGLDIIWLGVNVWYVDACGYACMSSDCALFV